MLQAHEHINWGSIMRVRYSHSSRCGTGLLLCFALACLGSVFAGFADAKDAKTAQSKGEQAPPKPLPLEISPEGVQALTAGNVPFLLVDADAPDPQPSASAGPVRLIYYTTTLSFRSAQSRAVQDRKGRVMASPDSMPFGSQRLIGTPLDWHRLGLRFLLNPLPAQPLQVTPRQLSEAIKDGVDLQIIDLRPVPPTVEAEAESPFPQALRLLPHQVEAYRPKLSKQRWIVLIDDGNRVAQPIAEQLFQQGYLLTTILDGGYPAWVNATNR